MKITALCFLLANVLLLCYSKKIAIIGAGISGTSTASNIRQFFPDTQETQIHIYEKNNRIGGRTYSTFRQQPSPKSPVKLEWGGTSVVKENRYAMNLVKRFNMTFESSTDFLAVVDNDEEKSPKVNFIQSNWSVLTILKMLMKYGWSVTHIRGHVAKTLESFLETYTLQEQGKTWNSAAEWLQDLGLLSLSQITFADHYSTLSKPFLHDILGPIIHENYMQNITDISAFAGTVVLTGLISEFYSFKEGADHFAKSLAKESGASIFLNTTVQSVTKLASGQYRITTSSKEEDYDIVVIATPLEKANIELHNINVPPSLQRDYVDVHSIAVTATNLNFGAQGYFSHLMPSKKPNDTNPYYILYTSPDASFPKFAMISEDARITMSDNKQYNIFRIFTRQPVSRETLDVMFENVVRVDDWYWKDGAYANLRPSDSNKWPKVLLDTNLYYQNAFETAISTMETQMISSKNVALMIKAAP